MPEDHHISTTANQRLPAERMRQLMGIPEHDAVGLR
jgi:hypothetical protein